MIKKSNFNTLLFCSILISCSSIFCNKMVNNTPTPIIVTPNNIAIGADVSWLTQMEASGKIFYNTAGQQKECIALLKDLGCNTIRLRVWVNPLNGWNGLNDIVAKAIRAKDLGMRILIDFHYSDTWADPGNQTKPVAWNGQNLATLKTSVTAHTTQLLTALKNNNVTPEWVQIGNETNDGMLWPEGKASTNMSNFVELINSGYDAVKNIFPAVKVIVHLSSGYDNMLFRWMFDALKNNGAKFDVIGLSLYPSYYVSGWANANTACLANMNDMIARYNKEVMLVEVGMPWDNAADCKLFLTDIISKVKSIPNNKGIGVLYWEPQSYGNWQGYTLGAFDNAGKPTIALDAFK
jgi:arabinogalactan endo-1,4-beta-galactosidase